jgi:protocatechuate 3,4-dioxygenase beta subunit
MRMAGSAQISREISKARRLLKGAARSRNENMTHDHDQGLAHDLTKLTERAAPRRAVLKWALSLSATPLLACAGSAPSDGTGAHGAASGAGATTGTDDSCTRIPEETAGPYPGDGTNGANALVLTGIVRRDIRSSLAGASGVAEGVPLTVTLTIVDGQNGCQPIAGYAVYLWHCDRGGDYSMYSTAVVNESYLRGVQETDADGQVTFTTIFPGCYSGRWPHIHFEVYPSLAVATSGNNKVATSQLALPEDACVEAYTTDGYEASVKNLASISLETDNVFSDGAALETPTISGSVEAGFVAQLRVTV